MDRNDFTFRAVSWYLRGMPSPDYLLRFVRYYDDGYKKAQERTWTREQLLKSIGKLKSLNAEGWNIYIRPNSLFYVLIDDVKPDKLEEIKKINPCLIMETSPGNYQVFIRLQKEPKNTAQANRICRTLATQYDGDMGSADAMHFGRLPGFTNRKPERKMTNGYFPYVKVILTRSVDSTFVPPRGGVCKSPKPRQQKVAKSAKKVGKDRSKEDFAIACHMVRRGKSDDEIRMVLSQREKGSRRPKYVDTTVRKAREIVSKTLHFANVSHWQRNQSNN